MSLIQLNAACPLGLLLALSATSAWTQEAIESKAELESKTELDEAEIRQEEFSAVPPRYDRHVTILVGLPGDRLHQDQFDKLVGQWSAWMTSYLGVPQENLSVLSAAPMTTVAVTGVADAQTVSDHLQHLVTNLGDDDSLWILFLGHANYDGEQAFFHLPGPDLSAADYGEHLKSIRCREQVVWLTMGSSGWFLKPLSREGRLVIAATLTDAEPNETEFPQALADVMQNEPATLDRNQDKQVSIMELLSSVVTRINERYKSDERAPTEHAQLDDDGNGRGTEIEKLMRTDDAITDTPTPGTPKLDGRIAKQMILSEANQ